MWYQLNINRCFGAEVESLSEELESLGAVSVMMSDTQDHPILEPAPGTTPLWPEVLIQALFSQEEDLQKAKHFMTYTRSHLQYSTEIIEDKDWERAWMDDFKPQRFGQRLWICPTWITPPEPEAVNLMLDPGLAFGTGTHPTTALCLTWLEQQDLTGKKLIDYGCGSGILSLAALKLGAAQIQAVDIDPQALQATQNNAELNAIDETQLILSTADNLQIPVDLIIANILLEPLIGLKEQFYNLLLDQGLLVVSGILTEQKKTLIEAYGAYFELLKSEDLNGWSLIVFGKIAPS